MGELWVKNPFNPVARTTLLGVHDHVISVYCGASCLLSIDSVAVNSCELFDLVLSRKTPRGVGLGFLE